MSGKPMKGVSCALSAASGLIGPLTPACYRSHRQLASHAARPQCQRIVALASTIASSSSSETEPSGRAVVRHALAEFTSLQDLRQFLLDGESSGILSVHVPELSRRLSCLWRACPQGLLESAMLADVMPSMYALVLEHIQHMQPKEHAQAAIELSQLRYCDTAVLQQLAEATRPGFASISAHDLAALLAALADHGTRPSAGWLAALRGEVQIHLLLMPRDTPSALQASHNILCLYDTQALADHGTRPSAGWLAALMGEVQSRLGLMQGGPLVQLLWALVRLGVRPTSAWLGTFVEAAGEQQMAVMSASDLATLSRAFGEMAFQPPEPWLKVYLASAQQLLPSFQPNQLADLAWGLVRMKVELRQDWEACFLKVTQEQMLGLRTSDLVMLASTVAALRLRPSQAWLDGLMSQSLKVMNQFGPREIVELLPAVVQLQQAAEATNQKPEATPADTPSSTAVLPGGTPSTSGTGLSAASEGMQLAVRQRARRRRPALLLLQQQQHQAPGSAAAGAAARPLVDPAWMTALLESSRFKLTRFTAQALPLMIDCIAQAGTQPDSAWLTVFSDIASSKADVLSSHDMAHLLVTLSLDLDYLPKDPAHRAALAALLAPRVLGLPGPLMADALTLLMKLGCTVCSLHGLQPSSSSSSSTVSIAQQVKAQAWRQAVLRETLDKLPTLSEEQLGAVMVAAVKMELRPSATWVQACLSQVFSCLSHFNKDTLIPVIWAMAILRDDVRACKPQLVRAIMATAFKLSAGPAVAVQA